eukprot:6138330-Pyramimonas_sp.AAC.1
MVRREVARRSKACWPVNFRRSASSWTSARGRCCWAGSRSARWSPWRAKTCQASGGRRRTCGLRVWMCRASCSSPLTSSAPSRRPCGVPSTLSTLWRGQAKQD